MTARRSTWLSLSLALCSAVPAFAQDTQNGLTVSGSVRLRYETIDGQARPGFNDSDRLINLRTTLLTEYRKGDVRLAVEIYDSRVYGDDAGTPLTTGEVNALEPVQANIATDISEPLGRGSTLTLTAGRMMLNLGSRRLVAADDYRNTTNSYTGLRADLSAGGAVKATAIYVLPQMRLPDTPLALRDNKVQLDRESLDLVLWGGLVSKAKLIGPAMAELSYFHLGESDGDGRQTRDRSLDTMGGRLMIEPAPGKIDIEVEGFYQTGRISASLAPTAAVQRVSATFVHADLGYSFAGAWKPRLSVEYDRASGDKAGGSFGRFDTLFGMRRADIAPSGIYGAVARANISSPGIRLEATPSKRLDLFGAYRAMWLASDEDSFSTSNLRDATGRSGDFAGHQVDARVRYWLVPEHLRVEVDGVLLLKGRFLRDAPNAPSGKATRYGSLNLTASF